MLRIYYSNEEYEPNKHKILTFYSDRSAGDMPEETSGSLSNYSVIEIEERYNPYCYRIIEILEQCAFLDLPPGFYVNNSGEIVNSETQEVVIVTANPQKEAYKLSQLYGLTQQQVANYIENQIGSMTSLSLADRATLTALLQKLGAAELWLVKHTKLDE